MGKRRSARDPVNLLFGWVRRQSVRVKAFLAVVAALVALVALKYLVKTHSHFIVAAEAVHAAGIAVLVFKLTRTRNCSGLSLRSQELTAIFLAVRLCCSLILEKDIHTFLDFATLLSTLWVIYMIRFKLQSSYSKDLDNLPRYYMLVPCSVLAIFVHPFIFNYHRCRILWAFCVYLESVSVLPQLHLMQNAQMVEPFTSHYVFALGIARFFGCAHYILKFTENPASFSTQSDAVFWIPAVLIAELLQTFILADFCYYYVKSSRFGRLLSNLSSPV